MSALVVAVLVAGAAWLVAPTRRADRRRWASLLPARERPAERTAASALLPNLAAAALGVAVVVLVGGPAGVLLGTVTVPTVIVGLRYLTSSGSRARAVALGQQAPLACDLLAAVLASGADPVSAVSAVSAGVGEPLRSCLAEVEARLRLGSEARTAWAPLLDVPALEPIAAAMVRSAETGAPLADALRRAGGDLRQARRAALLSRARVVGVMSVLPLGLCFLPAFVRLGVVPVVVSLVGRVLELAS